MNVWRVIAPSFIHIDHIEFDHGPAVRGGLFPPR